MEDYAVSGAAQRLLGPVPAPFPDRMRLSGVFDARPGALDSRSSILDKRRSRLSLPSARQDPRPLQQKEYQELLRQEIFSFLVANDFEIDGAVVLQPDSLRVALQRTFSSIFRFLYLKIDPAHEFRQLDDAYNLLKNLLYPYLDSLNRTALSLASDNNWPMLMGALYWLVKLNLQMSAVGEADIISPGAPRSRSLVAYQMEAYALHREGRDTMENLAQLSERFRDGSDREAVEKLKQEQAGLLAQKEALEAEKSELEREQMRVAAVEDDLGKLTQFLDVNEATKRENNRKLRQVKAELQEAQQEVEAAERKQQRLQQDLEARGKLMADVAEHRQEKERLERAIADAQKERDAVELQFQLRAKRVADQVAQLQTQAAQLNDSMQPLRAQGYMCRVAVNLLAAEERGRAFSAEDLVNVVVVDEIMNLVNLASRMDSESRTLEAAAAETTTQLAALEREIEEQHAQCDLLKQRLKEAETAVADMRDQFRQLESQETLDADRKARETQQMEIFSNANTIAEERELELLREEWERLPKELQQARERLHLQLRNHVNEVLTERMDIQEQLTHISDALREEVRRRL